MDNMQLWLISSTDSINLNSGADGFYLNPDLDGLTGLPEIRSSNGVNGGYDGGWTSTQLWNARLITIRGLIVDKDGSVVEAKRKQLTKLVGQGKKDPLTLKFVSEAGHTYTCTVRTTNCTMALQSIYSRQEYQIQLRADDPLIYDEGGDDIQATLRVQTDSEGFEIPFDIPLDISGGADPVVIDAGEDANYPIITMYGDLHSPTIVNRTTNQQLQLGADLSLADTVVIDCKDRTVLFNGANAYNLLASGSEFIRLDPGENRIYLTSESTSDSGYAEVKFKTGNLSI